MLFQELGQQVSVIRQVADKVFTNAETTIRYKLGSMIEVPRAALIADEVNGHEPCSLLVYGSLGGLWSTRA